MSKDWRTLKTGRSGRAAKPAPLRAGMLLGALFVLGSLGCNSCGGNQSGPATATPEVTASPIPAASNSPPAAATANAQNVSGGCAIGGCGGELCVDGAAASEPTFTNCEYKRHFECYKEAKCGRDAQNQCNWDQSPVLTKCLKTQGGG